MIEEGRDLAFLPNRPMNSKDLEYEYRMDISGSVYTRMHELGMTQKDLASKMSVDKSFVTKVSPGTKTSRSTRPQSLGAPLASASTLGSHMLRTAASGQAISR